MEKLLEKALRNVRNILVKNLEVKESELEEEGFLIIYDLNSPLSTVLSEAYLKILPKAEAWKFYEMEPEKIIADLKKFKRGNTVILIESSSFRMSNFRWRLELFNLGLKVVEHAHLGENLPEETETYLDALEDQYDYYQKTSAFLKPLIDVCKLIEVYSIGGGILRYEGGMEEVKLNIGDFRKLHNTGCGFPIGEVFSEPKNLKMVNGEVKIYAFANVEHQVVYVEKPFSIHIKEGVIEKVDEAEDALITKQFAEIMDLIKSENPEGKIGVREFGLGMNRGLSKHKRLTDISAFERVCGMHISMGMKHDVYRDKVGKDRAQQRFHVDIFPDVEKILVDGKVIFENGAYLTE
jgi:aminopeptidase